MTVRFGDCVLDRGRRLLLRDEQPLVLTTKAMALLELLLERRPAAVSKADIHERLWPSTFVTEVNLARLVFELRRALDDDARKPCWIRTVRGFGYAFSGPATEEGHGAGGPDQAGTYRLLMRDREVTLAEGENVLGRSRSAAIWLASRSVSRRHAAITVRGGQALLVDLGSKNGTFCNDRRIRTPTALGNGDSVRVGQVELTFLVIPPDESTSTHR
jgi:DNA-binding winged helix-turn-helix (wHTH) protein